MILEKKNRGYVETFIETFYSLNLIIKLTWTKTRKREEISSGVQHLSLNVARAQWEAAQRDPWQAVEEWGEGVGAEGVGMAPRGHSLPLCAASGSGSVLSVWPQCWAGERTPQHPGLFFSVAADFLPALNRQN